MDDQQPEEVTEQHDLCQPYHPVDALRSTESRSLMLLMELTLLGDDYRHHRLITTRGRSATTDRQHEHQPIAALSTVRGVHLLLYCSMVIVGGLGGLV